MRVCCCCLAAGVAFGALAGVAAFFVAVELLDGRTELPF